MRDFDFRLLLDEHYPGWLAEKLTAAGIDSHAVIARDDLRGFDDITVLRTATAEHRIVVDAQPCERWVLADWRENDGEASGEVLVWSEGLLQRQPLQ